MPQVIVPLGEYVLDETLSIPSGVTILCAPGASFVAGPQALKGIFDSLIEIRGSEVTIIGCRFAMDKTLFVEPEWPLSEFRHAVHLVGASNVRLIDVTVEGAGGDGLCIDPLVTGQFSEDRKPSRSVQVERLTAKANLRTGMAIVSCEGCTVANSTFQDTKGVSTGAGLIVEPSHAADRASQITIDRCTARNNAGSAFRVNMDRQTKTSKPISVEFRECIGEKLFNGHYLIELNQWEVPMNPVKPLGKICWDKSCQTNP